MAFFATVDSLDCIADGIQLVHHKYTVSYWVIYFSLTIVLEEKYR